MALINVQNLKLFAALLTLLSSALIIASLFMLMPNENQQRITRKVKDRDGYGIIMVGVLFAFASAMYATGVFTPVYQGYDLSGLLTMFFANLAGMALSLGVLIALPNSFTDRALDQKNIWILVLGVVVLIGVLSYLL